MNYSNYTEQTQQYMKSVEKFLKKKFGVIRKEWELGLIQIAQCKEICDKAFDDIQTNGVTLSSGRSNPAIKDYTTTSKTLLGLLREFGINPMAKIKVDRLEVKDEKAIEEETLRNMVEDLIE